MGRKTSVYLSDDLDAQCRASGIPLAELIRRGLTHTHEQPLTRTELREELARLPITTCRATTSYTTGDYETEPYLSEP